LLIQIYVAVIVDWILGDPQTWPHPVRFMGMVIKITEKQMRRFFKNEYIAGAVLWGVCISTVCIVYWLFMQLLPDTIQFILEIYIFYACIAAKCLAIEGNKIKGLIANKPLEESRRELSYLVGRQTDHLSRKDLMRGIIETISENTIDGVLAPIMYMLLGAPFGASAYFVLIYKMVNTLDSMVGYEQEPYKKIGFVSAKMDDLFNYMPARIGAVVMLMAGIILKFDLKNGLKILKRDHKNHKSPNCGYPESVTAGLLNIQLGGTNTYHGVCVKKPTIGDGTFELRESHIDDTIKMMYLSEVIMMILTLPLIGLNGGN